MADSSVCAWLMLSILVVLLVLWFVRESYILEPVQPARSQHWQQYDWHSGDVLLFSGMGWLGRVGEAVLKLCGRSSYTHVGLIYVRPGKDKDSDREVYVWEMGRPTVGTKLTSLERVMTRYQGRLVVRPLQREDGGRGVDSSVLQASIRKLWGLEYAYDFWFFSYNRVFRTLPLPRWTSGQDRPVRFCSDLVAETLAAVGVLDYSHSDLSTSETIPRDFGQHTQRLPLAAGWQYGDEILLTGTRQVPADPKG